MKKYIWVVRLDNLSRRNPVKDKIIVRARSKDLAIQAGKANSTVFRNRKSQGTAHIADPVTDLGCKSKNDTLSMYAEMRASK